MASTAQPQAQPAEVGADRRPQGTCPNAWVALVNGEAVRTSAGGTRRYGTEAAALKAARKAREAAQ